VLEGELGRLIERMRRGGAITGRDLEAICAGGLTTRRACDAEHAMEVLMGGQGRMGAGEEVEAMRCGRCGEHSRLRDFVRTTPVLMVRDGCELDGEVRVVDGDEVQGMGRCACCGTVVSGSTRLVKGGTRADVLMVHVERATADARLTINAAVVRDGRHKYECVAQKFAFWKPTFWRSGERHGTTSSDEVALVVIQNKAAAEKVPVSAEAEHALVEQFAQMTEHCVNGACAPEMLDTCDGSVLMQQVAHIVERRFRNKMWIARMEGRHDSESGQACLLAFYSGILVSWCVLSGLANLSWGNTVLFPATRHRSLGPKACNDSLM